MSNWLKLWRGCFQPLETGPQPRNVLRLWRGAVEPLVPFGDVSAKITGNAVDCSDVALTGIGDGSGGAYLQTQSGVSIALQGGGFLELQASRAISTAEQIPGIMAGVSLTGVLNR